MKPTNFSNTVKKYFSLSTYDVSLMGVLLALSLIIALFDHYVLGLQPLRISGFLIIELNLFLYILVKFKINLFYMICLISIATWLRIPILQSEPIGVLSLWIVDLLFIIFYSIFFNSFSLLVLKKGANTKRIIIVEVIALCLTTIVASALATGFNALFLLKLYGINDETAKKSLIIIVLWFNVVKNAINGAIALMLTPSFLKIAKKDWNRSPQRM